MDFKDVQSLPNYKKLLYFFKFSRPYLKLQIFIVILTQLAVILGLVNPYLSKLVIDDAYKNRNLRLFVILVTVGGVIFLLTSVINHIIEYKKSYICRNINFELNKNIVAKVYDLNFSFFRDTFKSDNLYKLNYDIEGVTSLIVDTPLQLFRVIPTFIWTMIILIFLNWEIALVASFSGIFVYIHMLFFTKKRKKIMYEVIERRQAIFSHLYDSLSKMYLVKASGKEEREKIRFVDSLSKLFDKMIKSLRLEILSNFSSELVGKLALGFILCFGGYQIIIGKMTLGTLTSLSAYLFRVLGFHTQISFIFQQFSLGSISCERLFSIVKEIEKNKDNNKNKKRITFSGNIEFKDVSFYYLVGEFVLDKFNMLIRPGEKIGLVGYSGCGKSTVVNLLLGLYSPIEGEVKIEGVSITEIDLVWWRENIGIVLQEPYFIGGSVKDNLIYFNEFANDDEIKKVLEEVYLDKVIKGLSKGLDTDIGDDACKLSQGEKQRLALARALLRKPKLLVLDEALSFVDNWTSSKIIENIVRDYPYLTMLIITHNHQLLFFTHRVIFMKVRREIIEGEHRKLLSLPQYRSLFNW
ncbi:MAG: ABC transporter ATP-binding protein/permease [Candidatus Omnitrophica bacterium]|nr:ABC transporter ATP-binding protein/permease [Candidatus Omnitrophota bacterium]